MFGPKLPLDVQAKFRDQTVGVGRFTPLTPDVRCTSTPGRLGGGSPEALRVGEDRGEGFRRREASRVPFTP